MRRDSGIYFGMKMFLKMRRDSGIYFWMKCFLKNEEG